MASNQPQLRNYNIDDDFYETSLSNEATETKTEAIFTTIMEKAATPEQFNGRNLSATDWLDLVDLTFKANGYEKATDYMKKIPRCMTGVALKWFITWRKENEKASYDDFAKAIKSAFPTNLSKISSSLTARDRKQRDGEPFAEYAADKLHLIKEAHPQAPEADKIAMLIEGACSPIFEEMLKKDIDSVEKLIAEATKSTENKKLSQSRKHGTSNTDATFSMETIDAALNLIQRQSSNFQRGGFRGGPRGRGRGGGFNGRGGFNQNRPQANRWTGPPRQPFNNSRPSLNNGQSRDPPTCHFCGRVGHLIRDCRTRQRQQGNLNRN